MSHICSLALLVCLHSNIMWCISRYSHSSFSFLPSWPRFSQSLSFAISPVHVSKMSHHTNLYFLGYLSKMQTPGLKPFQGLWSLGCLSQMMLKKKVFRSAPNFAHLSLIYHRAQKTLSNKSIRQWASQGEHMLMWVIYMLTLRDKFYAEIYHYDCLLAWSSVCGHL